MVDVMRHDITLDHLRSTFRNGALMLNTMLGTLQHNGIAKTRNHTLLDMVGCMLINSSLPEFLLGKALKTTAYILNQVLSM